MTDKKFLPFSIPYIGDEEISEVIDTLRSGWLTTGPKVKQFENDFQRYLSTKITPVAVNSATAGLHLALEALNIGPGDEVIVPTYTFTATAGVVRYLGAEVVLVDIDPKTLNIDPTVIEGAITPRTRALIPVHFAGLACDMEAIMELAGQHGLKVIEDAAHALPSTRNKKLIGTLKTDATVFSFYANKTMTTGEGGMIIPNNAKIAQRCRLMRLHGINRDVFSRYVSDKPEWYYDVVELGYKYNMTDIAAAIGIHQLRRIKAFHERREVIANRYLKAFSDLPLILPALPTNGDKHAWHLYVIQLKDKVKMSRDTFIEKMKQEGIGCSVHFIPLHLHPYWRNRYGLNKEDYPFAQAAFQRAVSLPLYYRMSDCDVDRVIDTVYKVMA